MLADSCLSFSVNWKKINDDPVCLGAAGDTYGTFTINRSGLINTFKLVYRSGSVNCVYSYLSEPSHWGCKHSLYKDKQLATVLTYTNRSALLIADYLRKTGNCDFRYYSYRMEETDVNSTELVFNHLLPPLNASLGQKFQIWYAEDLVDCTEFDNSGQTCVDVYAWYI